MKIKQVKVGDKLTRILGGHPMTVIVGEITKDTVKCGSEEGTISWEDGWTFDRKTGVEIDDYLEWGPKYGKTGSFIQM